ncbi:MAG TPA: TRAP transporter substrate-binding protein [Acetobacteraceae bacterium]|jgi:TRAP-type C4-dicarboxylate transport system substrate-binding protein|nr:TRAP transporter substrate-binding protein [Acetobacteraceae bacterium]
MIELHFAGYQPARSVHTRGLSALRDSVTRRAGSILSIKVTDSVVSLGRKAADLLTMVESGELDGCYFASSYLAARVPALSVFDAPFQGGARETVFGALDPSLADQVAGATGYRVIGWWDNGIRHISNAARPIRSPADCTGLRLRTLDNAQHQAAFRRCGFVPTFIDVADLARAVADGSVDAQENPLTNMVNFDIQNYHKHVSLTGHLLGIALLLVNRARYDALPTAARTALDEAARDSEAAQRSLAIAEDAECLRVLVEAGVAVLAPDEIDLSAFRAAAVGTAM